jgi:FixJ family two-component response regulator
MTQMITRDSDHPLQILGHVAVVDDDTSMRVALSRFFAVLRIDCRTYSSGEAFLMALPSPMPTCLILDVNMPDMTGIELRRQLLNQGIHIPTIFITGVHDERAERYAESLGAEAFLYKPVGREALMAALYCAVKNSSYP